MADTGESSDNTSSTRLPHENKVIRSQKIIPNPAASEPGKDYGESDESIDRVPLPRSHTPGRLAQTSTQGNRRQISDVVSRPIPRSTSQTSEQNLSSRLATPGDDHSRLSAGGADRGRHGRAAASVSGAAAVGLGGGDSTADESEKPSTSKRPSAARSTSSLISRSSAPTTGPEKPDSAKPTANLCSPLTDLPWGKDAPDVPIAPASGMYWSKAPTSGAQHTALRAHTTTIIGSNVYIFGGCDSRTCFNTLYVLDADAYYWSVPHVVGTGPVPLRAMTCTAVGKKLVIFGGGDGPTYYNDVYILDTVNFRWTKPKIQGDKFPSKRRAHTACFHKNGIYIFGGGDGVRALNDIWRLDVSDLNKMSWKMISGPERKVAGVSRELRPKARGYHTANMVGSNLIVFGGSDGGECFDDVWVYSVESHSWKSVAIPEAYRRLSHTATLVGSYLFVIGGHDGTEYSNDVLLLNLVTMTWDKRKTYGKPPAGRGYHGAVLYDGRLVVMGGFDGNEVYGDVQVLELAVHAYYSQISHFTIDV